MWRAGEVLALWMGVVVGEIIMTITNLPMIRPVRPAWNRGRIVGQKRPLLPKHVWAIRVRLELAGATRDLALFNMAVDSKLRDGCPCRVPCSCPIAAEALLEEIARGDTVVAKLTEVVGDLALDNPID